MKELIERDAVLDLQPYDCDGDPCGKWDEPVFLKRTDLRALPTIDPAQIRADALREAAAVADQNTFGGAVVRDAILSLLDQPTLSAKPVDDKIGADPVANAARVLLGLEMSNPNTVFRSAVSKVRADDRYSIVVEFLEAIAEGQP